MHQYITWVSEYAVSEEATLHSASCCSSCPSLNSTTKLSTLFAALCDPFTFNFALFFFLFSFFTYTPNTYEHYDVMKIGNGIWGVGGKEEAKYASRKK